MYSRAETNHSSRTLATTTTMYRVENGRTYHAYRDGEYWQPNDAQQNNHEAIIHHICLMTLDDRLFLAPISSSPRHILDIATGTGIWATDIADKFPDAEVIGTDLSPMPPGGGMHPPNFHFEIDDCSSSWVYPEDHFDFIHIRGLFGSISDWPALYKEAYKHTKPGGWFEQLEWSAQPKSIDGTLSPENLVAQVGSNLIKTTETTGKTFEIAETMTGMVKDAGFINVVEKRFRWPIGPWSSDKKYKEIGRWNLLNWEAGMEGWTMALYTRVLGFTYQQVQDMLAELRTELKDRKMHAYHEVQVVSSLAVARIC
ncbi:S-adenosyl-L-methionine-dependent methyltransferase [Polychaeton citri CBS 116435]|uniref:S-adenosyl-L-methionine-dependent methyltransferase n=1 Tax=Polychaeton citri CBS 116435 TaxID=1314669 RepID=A0A9P4QC82_9PEZI|nr:S-adenosyl-L-methionine-dependent methyltransferase [Polychaeton citri CBS 116435]